MRKSNKSSTEQNKYNIVNKYKMVVIPLTIVTIAILCIGFISYFLSSKLLLELMEEKGIALTLQASTQFSRNSQSLDTIDLMLESKIRIAANMLLSNRDKLSNEYLKSLLKTMEVDELYWLNKEGEIIYSTEYEYIGWKPEKGHPLFDFALNSQNELMEDIRPDAKNGIYYKFGAIKDLEGNFVQVAILAENIKRLTDQFSYQRIVDDVVKGDMIDYARFADEEMIVIASSDNNINGKQLTDIHKLKNVFQGNTQVSKLFYEETGSRVLEIAVPVYKDGNIKGALILGFSMKPVYTSILNIVTTTSLITTIMFIIFLWVQNRNIIMPIKKLNKNINKINLESNLTYRLPLIGQDTFLGLSYTINQILDKTNTYFIELNMINDEISATYEELSATEEELRCRYDETRSYMEKLEVLKQKYEIAIVGTGCVVWEIDVSNNNIYLSNELENEFKTRDQKKDDNEIILDKFISAEIKSILLDEYKKVKEENREEIYSQISTMDMDGNLRWLLVNGKGVLNNKGESSFVNGIIVDMTELKEQEEYIEYLAYHDPLTGLPNRRKFLEKLNCEIKNERPGAVFLLDLDNFKGINDMLGHVYGDKVLKKVSSILSSIENEEIFVSRFGGDEFLILYSGQDDTNKIEALANKITNLFADKFAVDQDEIYISCSMGISRYPEDSTDVDQLIMNADMSMYIVKDLGKNSFIFFDEKMTKKLRAQIELETLLRDAIREDGFKLVYQPQISVQTGETVAFEALLRLKNHSISPGDFIPVAEEKGMIIEIGRWVTKEAIIQLSIWKKKGLGLKPISINFSAKQLNDEGYIDFLLNTIKEYELSPDYIEIEVTESILLVKTEETIKFLNELKSLGFRIALDDFGTGYSSLSYLTFVPVDKIKLDKSLNDKFLEIENIKVMDSIISLTHSLNLEVIAEGIESIEQFRRLKVGGCDYIQGYLFSKPLEVQDAEKIYNKNFIKEINMKGLLS